MTLQRAKQSIALIWFAGAGVLIFVMVAQTVGDLYGSKLDEAWGWFLPTVIPTLSMIIGVLVAEHQHRDVADEDRVMGLLVWVGIGLSVVYLLLVAVPIVAPAFNPDKSPLDLMNKSMIWLGAIQGLTAGVLAVFFQSSKTLAKQDGPL